MTQGSGQVREALIDRRFWNHHEAALAGGVKTTNSLESWHRDINAQTAKFTKKTVWYLIHFLKKEIGNSKDRN
jgi:hypothetical protein